MMRDDDNFSTLKNEQLVFKPLQRLRMKLARVGRFQSLIVRQSANPPVINHSGLGDDFRNNRVSIQSEIGPKGGAQEDHVADIEALVLQHMDVGAAGHRSEFGEELLQLLAVKLVIAQHVNDRQLSECLESPLHPIAASVDVTGKNYGVRCHIGRRERREFHVQITEDVQAHESLVRR